MSEPNQNDQSVIGKENKSRSEISITKNVLWNLVGTIAPLLAAIVSVPALISALGTNRFGVLTLAWMVVGYFSLFDMGIGRSLTKIVSYQLSNERHDEASATGWTGLLLIGALATIASIALYVASRYIGENILKVPAELRDESTRSLRILAFAIPLVVITTGLRGLLEAAQRFDFVNVLRVPLGIAMFAAPACVLPFSHRLDVITLVLLCIRGIALIAHLALCLDSLPAMRSKVSVNRSSIRELLTMGGWMTVTNIIGPVMIYMDRFFIGAFLSLSAVAFYVTPYEVVTKLLFIPVALTGVMFPAFSVAFGSGSGQAYRLYWQSVKCTFVSLYPVTFVCVLFANEFLSIWISNEFAQESYRAFQLLAFGVLTNGLALVPFSLIQSFGRPDVTAKLHIAELPGYLALLLALLKLDFGIEGVALAWTIRTTVDALCLFAIAEIAIPEVRRKEIASSHGAFIGIFVVTFCAAFVIRSVEWKMLFALTNLSVFAIAGWRLFLTTDERKFVKSLIRINARS